MAKLQAEHPHDAGVEERFPSPAQFEGAELLANEARPTLRDMGFTDAEIDEWAWTYIALEHSGDVQTFVDWIQHMEVADGAE